MKNIYNHLKGRITFIGLLFICGILFFVQILESELYEAIISGDYEYMKIAVSDGILYVYGFMLLIMVIQNTFTIIPLILVITINITVFGFLKGFLWSWFTSVLAAILIFISIRYLFTDRFSSKISPEHLKRIEDKGVSYILLVRVFPLIPTSLINVIAGLSSITLKKFVVGTAIGNFIYFFILALIPVGIFSSGINEYMIAAIIILMAVCYVLYRLKRKNNAKKFIGNRC